MQGRIIFRDPDNVIRSMCDSLYLEFGYDMTEVIKLAVLEFYEKVSKNPTLSSLEKSKNFKLDLKRLQLKENAKELYDVSNVRQRILVMLSKEEIGLKEIYSFKQRSCKELSSDVNKEGWDELKSTTMQHLKQTRNMLLRLMVNHRIDRNQLKQLSMKGLKRVHTELR